MKSLLLLLLLTKKYFVKLTLIFSKIIAFTKFLSKLCEKSEFTVWKNEKFTVTEKKFRQINSLVTSFDTVLAIKEIFRQIKAKSSTFSQEFPL